MKTLLLLSTLFLTAINISAQVLDTAWIKIYDYAQADFDLYAINGGTVTSDNHIVLIGCSELDYAYGDVFAAKIRFNGDTVWTRTLGGMLTHEVSTSIVETSDSHLVVLCIVQFEGNFGRMRLYKMNLAGDIIWEKTYLSEVEYAYSYGITETSDSGLIISGVCDYDIFIFKTKLK